MRGFLPLSLLLLVLVGTLACKSTSEPSESLERVAHPKVVSADGVEIAYELEGSGELALVFIHGWSCHRGFWREQVAHFAPTYKVVTLDLAGHGESGHERSEWTMEALGADVEAVVEALELDQVVLVGHSMGGPVAVEAARRMPDRVMTVIGVDTLHNVEQDDVSGQLEALVGILEQDFTAGVTNMVAAMFPPTADPQLVEWVTGEMTAGSPEVGVALMRMMAGYDPAAALAALPVPIVALNSGLFRERNNLRANRRHAPGFRLVLIDDAGHFPMLETPAELNGLVEKALERMVLPHLKPRAPA